MLFGTIPGFGSWDSMGSCAIFLWLWIPSLVCQQWKGCWELEMDTGVCGQTQPARETP